MISIWCFTVLFWKFLTSISNGAILLLLSKKPLTTCLKHSLWSARQDKTLLARIKKAKHSRTWYFLLVSVLIAVYQQNIGHHFVLLTQWPRMNWLALAVLAWVVPRPLIGWIFRMDQWEGPVQGTLEKAGLAHSAGLDCSRRRLERRPAPPDLDIRAGKHKGVMNQMGGKCV